MASHDVTAPPIGILPLAGGSAPRSRILVVEDQEAPRELLVQVLERQGYCVEIATDGDQAWAAICHSRPDVVLLDVVLPGLSGFDVCRRARADARTRLIPIVMMTGYDAHSHRLEGLSAGADDFLGKPFDIPELLARVASLARMKRYTDDLDSASAILTTLAEMIEQRFAHSPGHCHRMANYATAVGRALNVSELDMQTLYRGAFLHDIGMLAIPDAILQTPGRITDKEYECVKSHTTLGDALCANLQSLQSVRPIIRWHHERLDGSGYPDGLRGDAIPQVAQIVGVVEMYEALTTTRPYQQRFATDDALTLLRRHSSRGWLSSEIVEGMASVVGTMAAH